MDITVVHVCGHEGAITDVVINEKNKAAWVHMYESTPCNPCLHRDMQRALDTWMDVNVDTSDNTNPLFE